MMRRHHLQLAAPLRVFRVVSPFIDDGEVDILADGLLRNVSAKLARRLSLLLALLAFFAASGAVFTASGRASFGFQSGSFESTFLEEDRSPDVHAGSHPFALTTGFKFNIKMVGVNPVPDEDAKDIEVALPAGFVGNPTATPRCSAELFTKQNRHRILAQGSCPTDTQVGVAQVAITTAGEGEPSILVVGVYNLIAPPGVPAEFGLDPAGIPIVILPRVRTGGDYGVTAVSKSIPQAQRVFEIKTTLWGAPSAPVHDGERGECLGEDGVPFYEGKHCPVEASNKPFLTLPASCPSGPLATVLYGDSWQNPVPFSTNVEEGFALHLPQVVREIAFNHGDGRSAVGVSDCERLDFSPTVSVRPDTEAAGAPTGVSAEVSLPQGENANGLAEADLKKAVVALPAGMSISPSAANELQACTDTPEPPAHPGEAARPGGEIELYTAAEVRCPDASKVGTVEIETPLLETPLEGSVYVAQQGLNPFHSLLALYVVAEGSGVTVKLAGEVHADQSTGQLTTTFNGLPAFAGHPAIEGNPQQPFSHLRLKFFGGPRAALMTPRACGTYSVTGALTPWGRSLPVAFSQPFEVKTGCESGFSPSFVAGTVSNQAGAFSPFTLTLSRTDQEQGFKQLSVRIPPGLLGMLSKVQLCGEPQAAKGECPEASKIGHVTVGAGPGPDPVYVPQAGKPQDPVYLTGPYNGAPFGLSVVVPAEAGPFTLGPPVVVRSAIEVDPRTAQIAIKSDPFPTILEGVSLDIKTIHIDIDREGFIFNPTDCERLSVGGAVLSDQGATAGVSSRFQAANCATLGFKPKFSASTKAHPSHANGASLTVKVGYPRGTQANIAAVKVSLPKQLPSRLTTLQHACPEATFAANPASCPPESVVGTATATTPVLNVPVTGPAYLVSHGGAAFPDLIMILQGQGVTVELVGNTGIKAGITTSTFASVPDVPISSFEVNLPQGPHSALTENLPVKSKGSFCSSKLVMPTAIAAQNGLQIKQSTKVAVTGCPKKVKAKKAKAKKRK
jgi:hypothetical protein